MAGKAGRGGWQEIMRDHIFNVPGKYIFWLFFTIKGGCILQKHGFKADFFSLSAFEIRAMYYYLINLSTPQWGIVAALNRLAVTANV